MNIVLLTAFGVGGATCLGSLIGFLCKRISIRFNNLVMSFAAGIMLSSSILGLILPAETLGGIWVCVIGILSGAVFLSILEAAVPCWIPQSIRESSSKRVMLFAAAIAIHNLPEGLASGVAFGTGNTVHALLIAGGIAIQNIPEGMITVTPMIAAGISPRNALLFGICTGIVEIVGTILGYCAVTASAAILPYSLAFAGGTMLYVIVNEMIPQAHSDSRGNSAAYAFILGFLLMMISDILLS